jgi:hypothetical protein
MRGTCLYAEGRGTSAATSRRTRPPKKMRTAHYSWVPPKATATDYSQVGRAPATQLEVNGCSVALF